MGEVTREELAAMTDQERVSVGHGLFSSTSIHTANSSA